MLHLRPYKKCDAGHIVNWCKDEVSFHKWCADRFDHFPISEEELHAYYEEYAEDDGLFAMTAFDDSDTAGIAGHLMMRFLDKEKTVLRFGFIVVGGLLGLYGVYLSFALLVVNLCSVKSMGVPATGSMLPVGMSVSSVGR